MNIKIIEYLDESCIRYTSNEGSITILKKKFQRFNIVYEKNSDITENIVILSKNTKNYKIIDMIYKLNRDNFDISNYNTLIYAFNTDVKKTTILFNNMIDDNIIPNVSTYNTIISITELDYSLAKYYWDHIHNFDIKPNKITYNAIISSCKNLKDADFYFILMKKNGIHPTRGTYNKLISLCMSNLIAAENYFNKMNKNIISPSYSTYCLMIKSCKNDPIKAESYFNLVGYKDRKKLYDTNIKYEIFKNNLPK